MKIPTVQSAITVGAIVGLVMFVVTTGTVIYFGGTFGQRCAKMYPNDAIQRERCIHDLVRGIRP